MIDGAKFIEICESAGLEPRSYSGRGMYGASCVGVEHDRGEDFKVVADITRALAFDNEDEELLEQWLDSVLPRACTDSMGRGSILYFPSVRWPEGE